MSKTLFGIQHEVSEWGYRTGQAYADPFGTVELDAVITGAGGEWRVSAYWAGGGEWRVRFAPPQPGTYQVRTECSDAANVDLHAQALALEARPYAGDNPLLVHGGLRVAASRRTLEHADGTPFFWLGDTWWMGFCTRLKWPEGFQSLTADRVAKGYTLVQIVAGLYPDMPGFDPRGANEGGFPWEAGYATLNPAYFDQADLRIAWLVRAGLVPCIVGSWGYYLPQVGSRVIKLHWRNMIARWGAYPVMWCLAGEAASPYYLTEDREGDVKQQVAGWMEIGRYIKQLDPFQRPLTLHAAPEITDQPEAREMLATNMIEPAHGGEETLIRSVKLIQEEYQRQPVMPVLIDEISYEGILHYSGAEVQRFGFWTGMLSGAAGHTYGANGIWQMNSREQAYGPSPHGSTWGNMPWDEAAQLPGAAHVALGKRLLERYEWWKFEPHQDWVSPAGSPEAIDLPFAAGIPGKVRVIYIYGPSWGVWANKGLWVTNIEPGAPYQAFFWDPRTGEEHPLGAITPDAEGKWVMPNHPTLADWVLVFER